MPRNRPAASGYARIAQAEEEEEEEAEQPYSDSDDVFISPKILSSSQPEYAPIQPKRRNEPQHLPAGATPPRRPRRRRTNSGVDIKAINARLERWAEEIKERFKIRRVKGRSAEDEHLEIYSSVFQAPDWCRPATRKVLEEEYDDVDGRMSKLEFDDIVESVRTAIELGMHPKLIAQGSSGSYFARNSGGKVVAVFKPKDEEPYASKNPKWTKWIHRNLLPFAFGRAMLIPNLSYVSEAAAYVLDCQLRTNLVPYTDVVSFSSKSFHYDYFERRAFYRKHKPFPEKPGSFQIFLKGYKGATDFFREHPWPDQHNGGFKNVPSKKRSTRWDESCRPNGKAATDEDSEDEEAGLTSREANKSRNEFWSEELQQSFREQLEKLVILDYVMRNTDRGTDNWMIRVDREKQEAQLVVDPPNSEPNGNGNTNGTADPYHRRDEGMTAAPAKSTEYAVPRIGAIDNSLSWPWKHPDAWRSYPFGWLFLPVSLIGRPFSENTRRHFLPLLTSKDWWRATQVGLRKCFEMDADFQEKMYARQIAVMKGQAWNVVETLKTPDHGPLELARRSRVLVWDDVVDIPVAVPLARPSDELRRATRAANADHQAHARTSQGIEEEEEEMDISATHASAPPLNHDLLGLTTPSRQSTENPFNASRQNSSSDVRQTTTFSPLPPSQKEGSLQTMSAPRPGALRSLTGAGAGNNAGRMSHEIPRGQPWQSPSERRRRFSGVIRRGRGFGGVGGVLGGDEEDDDGDLGYAAANHQESRSRRVIVERLEMVKSKPPFFTWC